MDFKISRIITLAAFVLAAAGIVFLIINPFGRNEAKRHSDSGRTRIILPEAGKTAESGENAEQMAWEDSVKAKVPLDEGDQALQVISQDVDEDTQEEQIIVFRNLLELESPIYITFIQYDPELRAYRRYWSAPTAATRPGTVSVSLMDLVGDRSVCILVAGMNGQEEHTLTVFRLADKRAMESEALDENDLFSKIAEIRIDGTITVQETERSGAYQQGVAPGQSFTISAFGHDWESQNLLDQIEILYAYNPVSGLYEQAGLTRVSGAKIEENRLRELLSGKPGVFEAFIHDLWYYVNRDGTVDRDQYIYFDPERREIIFFTDNTQQVFQWGHSSPTRYGIYISSQNISVSTLRRSIDIELETLDSIRVQVSEDVRLILSVNDSWDGSYRRAWHAENGLPAAVGSDRGFSPFYDAVYESTLGRLSVKADGSYELENPPGTVTRGRYVFFGADGKTVLELQDEAGTSELYTVEDGAVGSAAAPESAANGEAASPAPAASPQQLALRRVRLGTRGLVDEGN